MISGTTDRNTLALIRELEKNGHKINTVYDIGANDGRWFKSYKPHLKDSAFIMFEANPNIDFNPSIEPMIGSLKDRFFNQVLSDEDGKTVDFYILNDGLKKENTGHSYYRELTPAYTEGNSIKLKTKKLDTMITENLLPLPDFIKMDTQGAEVDIMNGGSTALEHCKILVTEMPISRYNEGAPKLSTYFDTLYDHGFIPSGVDHIAIRQGVFNQMDVVFVKKEIVQKIHNYKGRYLGF